MLKGSMCLVASLLIMTAFTASCRSTQAPAESSSRREDTADAKAEAGSSGLRSLGIPVKEYDRDYRSIPHDPHGPAAHLNPPASHVSGPVDVVDIGALSFAAPEGWEYQHPVSSMRRAEFGVRSSEGNGTAGLVVYYFGDRGAGATRANVDRWINQFRNEEGGPLAPERPVRRKIAGFDVTEVELFGTYIGGMGSGDVRGGRSGQRMIATIVHTKNGPYYFKFLGDDEVVKSNRDAFDKMLATMKPSDD